jgi:hypothetical protein
MDPWGRPLTDLVRYQFGWSGDWCLYLPHPGGEPMV